MPFEPVLRELREASRPTLRLLPDPGRPARVALLSGSFDPLTLGHVALADAARERATVVALVYSVRTVAKEPAAPPSLLPEEARLRTVRGYCDSRPGTLLGLCSHGLLVEQARAARERLPGAELLMVMGSDKVLQVLDPRWYADRDAALAELFEHVRVLYAVREGEGERVARVWSLPANAPWRDRFEPIALPPEIASISSRDVRERVRRGDHVRPLVPGETMAALRELGIPAGERPL